MKKTFLLFILTALALPAAAQIKTSPDIPEKELQPGWIKVYHGDFVGIIDVSGVEIVPPIYDEIREFGTHKPDWALISKDGFYGFIDNQGNAIVAANYEQINAFGEYRENWALIKRDGYFGFIDESGYEIVKPAYDHINQVKKPSNP